MLIEILKVDHGFCAIVTADNGRHILLDCGHSALTGLRPSTILRARGIQVLDALIVSHADEDHLSDLPQLMRSVFVRSVVINDSLDSVTLDKIKNVVGSAGPGTELLIWRKSRPVVEAFGGDSIPILPGAQIVLYRNPHPWFDDLNNLSLVTFLHYGDIHAIFPGDLEADGWRSLLQCPEFCAELSRVNVFFASHHGRENGFCEEVFDICLPELIVISDGAIRYASQGMTDRYAQMAQGVYFGYRRRRVLTTRCDGTIGIWQSLPHRTRAWAVTGLPIWRASPSQSSVPNRTIRRTTANSVTPFIMQAWNKSFRNW